MHAIKFYGVEFSTHGVISALNDQDYEEGQSSRLGALNVIITVALYYESCTEMAIWCLSRCMQDSEEVSPFFGFILLLILDLSNF